jgi:carbonic anhydrase
MILKLSSSCEEISYTNFSSWGGLCNNGANQSPVDLTQNSSFSHYIFPSYTEIDNIESYNCSSYYIIPVSGNAIYLKDLEGNSIACKAYNVSFHTPAEHTINSTTFDLEMQVFHQVQGNSPYTQVIVSVLFNISDDDPNFFFDDLITEGELSGNISSFDLSSVLTNDIILSDYYVYSGSFTTPPCTESVLWYVLGQPQTIATDQIDAFYKKWKDNTDFPNGGNNRPVQNNTNPVFYRPGIAM